MLTLGPGAPGAPFIPFGPCEPAGPWKKFTSQQRLASTWRMPAFSPQVPLDLPGHHHQQALAAPENRAADLSVLRNGANKYNNTCGPGGPGKPFAPRPGAPFGPYIRIIQFTENPNATLTFDHRWSFTSCESRFAYGSRLSLTEGNKAVKD
jgi:hypothetical protein